MPIMTLLRRVLPGTLRGKLMLLSLLVVSIPIATTGYVMEMKGREARKEEKLEKLFGLARLLDSELGDGLQQMLSDFHGPDDRAAEIAFLNKRLGPFTDAVAEANPGVGVGYYSKTLDAIITYGPSREYGGTVGRPIPAEHPGWKVLASGQPAVETGPQVRGLIMNAMWPITRHGQVEGYIWANELTHDIDRQDKATGRAILAITAAGIALGLTLAHLMSAKLSRDVATVTNGLARLRYDLGQPIPRTAGEIGEIAGAINAMAGALLDARSLNDNILSSIADGVIAVDVAGAITSINPAAQRMMGIRSEDAVGRPYQELYSPHAGFASTLLDTLEHGREHINVVLDYPAMEQTLRVSASSSVLRDGAGRTIGAVVVIKDLSEQHRLQKQIQRADRLAALGEMMAGIAHEIRNPLTSIRGFLQYLDSCTSLEEWQSYAPTIIRQVDSLNRIITEFLEFSRHRPPSIGPVALNDLIREVTLLGGSKSAGRVQLALSPDLPMVEADGEALKQVLLNMVINAMQAIEDDGSVIITTAWDDAGKAIITVADDGVGIAKEDLEKVFDPFYSTKPTGTGLGLAVAHRIVDTHGGTITIDSEPGAGTKVTLHLPIKQLQEAS